MKALMVCLLAVLVTVPAFAGPPLNGTYKSTDLGGPMLTGRYCEYWPGATRLSVNNTMNEKSWDGASLGTQWWFYCPRQAAPALLLFDGVSGGSGPKIWRLDYTGGICWLAGSGPWGNGDPSYVALIDIWTAIVTESYSGGVVVGQIRTINAQATFQAYNAECINLQVSNTEWFGDTNGGALPAGYPDFWDGTSCSSAGTTGWGEYGNVTDITFDIIGCATIPVERLSWGSLKARYEE